MVLVCEVSKVLVTDLDDQTNLQVDANKTQVAKKPSQCSLAHAYTKENNTETNLHQVGLGGQMVKTCVHFRSGVSLIRGIASYHKSSRKHA